MLYTFYSYKGGVGRSMALANIATLLTRRNKRVLAIDWDLEAPGIERYFQLSNPKVNSLRNVTPGIVDIFESLTQKSRLDWRECLINVTIPDASIPLSIISAGKNDGDYASRLQNLDWDNLFEFFGAGLYINQLRTEWLSEYDYVLIDSRTGITDIGGICTIHLPDVLVLFFTNTLKSIGGVYEVTQRARKSREHLPFDIANLMAVPILARDESHTEFELTMEWRRKIASNLEDLYVDWLPININPLQALEILHIPYIPYWSFGERLPVIEQGVSEPGSLGDSYRSISDLIYHDFDWHKAFPESHTGIELNTESGSSEENPSSMYRTLDISHKAIREKLEILGQNNISIDQANYSLLLDQYIDLCDKNESVDSYNFSGLRFSDLNLKGRQFNKKADFSGATFLDQADFSHCVFNGTAIFDYTSFRGGVDFFSCSFNGRVSFLNSLFDFDANFQSITFSANAIFSGAKLEGAISFNNSSFHGECLLDNIFCGKRFDAKKVIFSASAFFKGSQFLGYSDFSGANFNSKSSFSQSQFHDEVNFEEAIFALVRSLPLSNDRKPKINTSVSVKGAVLRASYLWSAGELKSYDFSDSFLLGISLADKKIKNCNFTGAVMKKVFTDGWELDENTIMNTKYIYTDYAIEERTDGSNTSTEVYVPKKESRVPADGFFGEGDNTRFTIKEYFYRPYEWNYALNLPAELRETILNVVQFFRYYAEKAKGSNVDIATRNEGRKIRVVFQVEKEDDRLRVEKLFHEYIEKIFNIEGFRVEFENPSLSEFEKAEIQRKTSFLQQAALIELSNQLLLGGEETEKTIQEILKPILQREREELMDYTLKVMDKVRSRNHELSSNTQFGMVSESKLNKSEVILTIGDLVDSLDSIGDEIGLRKVRLIQTELEDVIVDIREDRTSEAVSRWKVIWNTTKEISGFAAKFPKIIELGKLIERIF